MQEYISKSIEDTNLIAKNFANSLKPSTVVCMTGDLGSGKTAFVKCVANALGIKQDIVSPTFNILLQYESANGYMFNHFDLYRLDSCEELEDIGFYEVVDDDGISFIEWSEKFPNNMPSNSVYIDISKLNETERKITIKN